MNVHLQNLRILNFEFGRNKCGVAILIGNELFILKREKIKDNSNQTAEEDKILTIKTAIFSRYIIQTL